jgi:hypothetical protein
MGFGVVVLGLILIVVGMIGVLPGATGFLVSASGLLVTVIGAVLAAMSFYRRTSADQAFVRTGLGKSRVVSGRRYDGDSGPASGPGNQPEDNEVGRKPARPERPDYAR